jgi:UDP-N-acetylmuramate-alanine ligase
MKLFVFQYIGQVSENYHSGGGLAIVANDEEHVKELVQKEEYIEVSEKDWEQVVIYNISDNTEAKIFVFPDAGCC